MGTIAKSKTVFSTGLESMSYAVKKCHVRSKPPVTVHILHTLAAGSLEPSFERTIPLVIGRNNEWSLKIKERSDWPR